MKSLPRAQVLGFSLLTVALLLPGAGIAYDKGEGRDPMALKDVPVKYDSRSSRSFAFDNDILVPGTRDQDYTYGLSLSFTGGRVEDHWASLHAPLGWFDQRVGFDRGPQRPAVRELPEQPHVVRQAIEMNDRPRRMRVARGHDGRTSPRPTRSGSSIPVWILGSASHRYGIA